MHYEYLEGIKQFEGAIVYNLLVWISFTGWASSPQITTKESCFLVDMGDHRWMK